MNYAIVGSWVIVALLLWQAGVVVGEARVEKKLANGEIACEYHYGTRKCWNPKEEEK